MALTHSQKKYLKKNLKRFSLKQIAINLNITENEILQHLKSNWPKEKYQNFLKKQRRDNQENLPALLNHEEKSTNFNFKNFLKKNWKILLFLSFLVFITYVNSLHNDFVSDDIGLILKNKNIGNLFYYLLNQPKAFLRSLLYFFAYKIDGLNPLFFRLINIFFHLGSVWLIYGLISLLVSPVLALFTAGIFAVHPIETEAVTWISGGPYSQYSFFLLLAFLLFVLAKYKNQPIKFYLASIFTFLLALFTTEKALIFPLILLSFEITFGIIAKNWKKLIPFFSLSAFWTLFILFSGTLSGRMTSLETEFYQTPGVENPLVQIPIALASYLRLTFWPDKLTLYHSELNFTQWQYFLMLMITLAFLALIIWAYKKNRLIFFWSSFFIISLLPNLTPLKIGWVVAERYVYLGSIGIIFLIALAIYKIGQITKKRLAALIIFAIVILSLSTRTIIRNFDWKNQDTLWLATAKTSPSSHQNHNNLGDLYARHGEYKKAIEEFKKAVELKPNYGDAYHNLANVYHQINRDDLAEENYKKALEFNHNLWQSYQNLAAIHFSQKNFQLAKEELEKAIQIDPENTDLHANLGILYLNLDDKQKAKEEFQKALQIDPQNQKAQQQLELIK